MPQSRTRRRGKLQPPKNLGEANYNHIFSLDSGNGLRDHGKQTPKDQNNEMHEEQPARGVVKSHPAEISDLKESKMDGPTFRALREYFNDWGKEDPTLFKTVQRDVKRESK